MGGVPRLLWRGGFPRELSLFPRPPPPCRRATLPGPSPAPQGGGDGPRGCPARPLGVRASPATPDPTARGLPPGASATGSAPARPPRAEEGLIARWVLAAGPKCSRSRDGAGLPFPSPALSVLVPRWRRPGRCLTEPARAASWRTGWHRGPPHWDPLGRGARPRSPRAPLRPPSPSPHGSTPWAPHVATLSRLPPVPQGGGDGPRGCPARPLGVRASPATPDPTARGLPPGASAVGPAPARPLGPRRG